MNGTYDRHFTKKLMHLKPRHRHAANNAPEIGHVHVSLASHH